MPGHLSRDCTLRIRHQAEKQEELEKLNNRPVNVQMVILDLEENSTQV